MVANQESAGLLGQLPCSPFSGAMENSGNREEELFEQLLFLLVTPTGFEPVPPP